MNRQNYYIHVGIQCQSDTEAITEAAEIAAEAETHVELRECGTKRLICIVAPNGNISIRKDNT